MTKEILLDIDKELTHGFALTARAGPGHWRNVTLTRKDFIAEMLNHRVSPKKDGHCFLQGSVNADTRSAKSMRESYILGVDLDSGDTAEEIDEKLAKTGLAYVRYTTYSHLKDKTEILREQFVKWSGKDPASDSAPEMVEEYLVEVKGIQPHIVKGLTIVAEAEPSANGTLLIVQHQPISKMRLVFFLTEPFVFQGRMSQKDQIQKWRGLNAGFCETLGLHYDSSCTENARLFYKPTHPKDAVEYSAEFFEGKELDLESYPMVETGRGGHTKKITGNIYLDADVGHDKEDRDRYIVEDIRLKKWVMTKGKGFQLADMFEELCPDRLVDTRANGGHSVECPNGEAHSTVGGVGSYLTNAFDDGNDGEGFIWHCSHESCQGMDALDRIKMAVEDDWFPVEALLDEAYSCILEDDEEEVVIEKDEKGLTSYDKLEARIQNVTECQLGDIEYLLEDIFTIEQAGQITAIDVSDLVAMTQVNSKIAKARFNAAVKEIKKKYGGDEDLKSDPMYDDPTLKKKLRKMNRRHAYIDLGNNCILDEANSEANEAVQLRSTRNFYEKYQPNTVVVQTAEGVKIMEISKLWMSWSDRRTYEGVQFEPDNDDENMYNMFTGFPIEGDKKADWDILKGFIHETVCGGNDEYMAWLLTWFAHIIQEPGKKPGSAVVVLGKKGTGKSTMFKFFAKLMGRYAYTASRSKALTGEFNSHLMGKLFLQLEEGFFAGDKQAESVLKNMITETTIEFNKKFSDSMTISNYTRFAMTSNEDWVVPVSLEDERRFFVLEIGNERQGDLAFFAKMHKQMENGGLEAFMHYLENWDPLEHFDEGWNILFTPPRTEALMAQAQQSQTAGATFFQNMITDGSLNGFDGDEMFSLKEDEDNYLPTKLLKDAWSRYMAKNPRQAARFSADNKELFFKEIEQYLFVINPYSQVRGIRTAEIHNLDKTKNCRCVHIPSTKRIRELYKEKYQMTL